MREFPLLLSCAGCACSAVGALPQILLSGAPGLIMAGRVTKQTVEEMRKESEKLKSAPDSMIFYSWIQASAEAYQLTSAEAYQLTSADAYQLAR